jgi:sugar phosphate permease
MESHNYRWVILAIVTLANGIVAALIMGLPALGPALRDSLSLTLPQLGVVLAATEAGTCITPLVWGKLADLVGERVVVTAGLLGGTVGLVLAASVSGAAGLVVTLALTGALIGGASTASGSAVMGWFNRDERGFALGIRQMSVPICGAFAALTLPLIAAAGGVSAALLALAGAAAVMAVCSAAGIREPPATPPHPAAPPPGTRTVPLRDVRVWRVSAGASLLICAQAGLLGFVVVFLHDHRGLSVGHAAAVLAAIQISAGISRLVTGRWSDRIRRRVRPQLLFTGAACLGYIAIALLVDGPLVLLIPVLVATGVATMSGGGLAIVTAAELAGRANAGVAIGLFQTLARAASASSGIAFGVLTAATSWTTSFVWLAALAFASRLVLRPLVEEEEDRMTALEARLAAIEVSPGL